MSVGSIFKEPGFVGFPTEIGLKTVFSKPYYVLYRDHSQHQKSINHFSSVASCLMTKYLMRGSIGISRCIMIFPQLFSQNSERLKKSRGSMTDEGLVIVIPRDRVPPQVVQ